MSGCGRSWRAAGSAVDSVDPDDALDADDAANARDIPGDPEWLVLLDNTGTLLADFDKDAAGLAVLDDLHRVFGDGPPVGIRVAATADRSGSVPGTWSASTQQKLLLHLADPGEYGFFDMPRTAVPAALPGRALVTATRQVVQIAWPGPDLAAAADATAARWPGVPATAPHVGLLPSRIGVAELDAPARIGTDTWWLPVGIGDHALLPVGLELYEHEHALVCGPARSGRSTLLCAVAEAARNAPLPPVILALAVRRSPLRTCPFGDLVAESLEDLLSQLPAFAAARLLLLVDDADVVEDPAGALERLLTEHAGAHVVAAARSDLVRRAYGHWTNKGAREPGRRPAEAEAGEQGRSGAAGDGAGTAGRVAGRPGPMRSWRRAGQDRGSTSDEALGGATVATVTAPSAS